jgi:hypothetical protein
MVRSTPQSRIALRQIISDTFDLGHGHSFTPVVDMNDQLIGWVHLHRSPRGTECKSFRAVREGQGGPIYQIVQAKPLSLAPAIECSACGVHGRVTDGRWLPLSIADSP